MRPFGQHPLAAPDVEGIWVAAAARLGFRVERTADAYASTDGRGIVLIGESESLDEDDSLAQLVFHEICHAAVQGPSSWRTPDWGLSNVDDKDAWKEHACLRLQAHLAEAAGLRALMRPTTDYRHYYRDLPADALAPLAQLPGDEQSADLARSIVAWLRDSSWREPLEQALAATSAVLKSRGEAGLDADGAEVHPLGFRLKHGGGETCGTCAWATPAGGSSRPVGVTPTASLTCRQVLGLSHQPKHTTTETPACGRWEPTLDCQACGACCREAYQSVSVAVRDPVVWKHPSLVVRHGPRFEIRREGERCAALQPGAGDAPRWGCVIYEDRPRTCREFTAGSRHCLEARRRVGLSG